MQSLKPGEEEEREEQDSIPLSTSCVPAVSTSQQHQEGEADKEQLVGESTIIPASAMTGDDNKDNNDDLADEVEEEFQTSMMNLFQYPQHYPFRRVAKALIAQAYAASANQFLGILNLTFILSAVGRHTGVLELASVSCAISFANIVAISIAVGWSSACDSALSQAFGRQDEAEFLLMLQIAIFQNFILSVPCSFLFFYSAPAIKLFFGEEFVPGAELYLRHAVPYLITFSILVPLIKSLQAQLKAEIPFYSGVAATVVGFISAFTLVPRMGIAAAALTLFLANLAQFIVIIFLSPADALWKKVKWFDVTQWKEVAFNRFDKQKEYVELAVPSVISCVSEWWVFEIVTVVAARNGATTTAAFNIWFNITVSAWSLGSGFAIACFSFVGKLLGENRGQLACVFGRSCVLCTVLVGVACASVTTFFHATIFSIYSSDPEVLKELREALPLVWIWMLSDGTQYTMQAVFRGASKQGLCPYAVLPSLWLIGLPCSFLGVHYGKNLTFLILGYCCGFLAEIPALLYFLRKFEWDQLAIEISKKEAEEKEHEKEQEQLQEDEELVLQEQASEGEEKNVIVNEDRQELVFVE